MTSTTNMPDDRFAPTIGRPATGQPAGDASRIYPDVSAFRVDPGASGDARVAAAALRAISIGNASHCRITVAVQRGYVTLSGMVDWPDQAQSAIDAVTALPGVSGVKNQMVLSSVFVSRSSRAR